MKNFEFLSDDIYSMHAREEIFLNSDDTILSFSVLKKPSISIGKLQNYRDVDEKKALRDNIDITRRKTGGRFMYLNSDCVVLSFASDSLRFSDEVYKSVCKVITDSLNKTTQNSFFVENVNDIMHSSGRKLGGAAKVNRESRCVVHAYLRYSVDPEKLFGYCNIDGHPLGSYASSLEEKIISIKDFANDLSFSEFYEKFKHSVLEGFKNYIGEEVKRSSLSLEEVSRLNRIRRGYMNRGYIKGDEKYPSRGHCDLIAGSGNERRLKIPLQGEVNYV